MVHARVPRFAIETLQAHHIELLAPREIMPANS
jgi:hypothetical protein